MSDAPADSANLGSAYSEVGYKYDRKGIQQFFKDGEQAIAVHQRVQQSGQQAAMAYSQRAGQSQVQGIKQAAAQSAQLQRQQLQNEGKLAVAQEQRIARIEAADKARIAKTEAAEKAANARVEAEKIRAQNRLDLQDRRQNSSVPLPRLMAGFTGRGLLQTAGAIGLVTSVDQLIGKIGAATERSIELATRAGEIGPAFERATERAGIASDELLTRLKAASRGTVNEIELQASANKALALGVGQNAQEIADLLAIARQKGKDFGIDTAQAFNDIVTGLGRVSPLILDNLGITIDLERTNQEYAAAIGKTASSLTEQEKKQALVNEVLREGRDLIKQNADQVLSDADRQAMALARQEEALIRIGQRLAPLKAAVLAGTADLLDVATGGIGEQAGRANASLLKTADTYEQYARRVETANTGLVTGAEAVAEALLGIPVPNWLMQYITGVEQLTPAQYAAAQALIAMGDSAEEAERKVRGLKDVADELELIIGGGDDVLKGYEAQLLRIAAAGPEFEKQVREIAYAFGQTGDIDAFKLAIRDLEDRLSEQKREAARAAQATREKADADAEGADAAQQNADAQKALADAYISTARQIGDATQQRAERLAELDEQHAERVAALEQSVRDAAAATQQAILDAEAEAADQRAEIVQGAAERITQIEEQTRDRREQLISDYQQAEQQREADHQRELTQARLQANADELRSTADFVERLNDLTRKGRGRGRSSNERREAKRLLAEAQREAAELAQIDPEAAAQLLAARQRQILEHIESKRADDQLRRDAKRGGALTTEQVQAEIEEERALRDAANAAEIDLIKQTASEKQRRREQEGKDAKAHLDEQLKELEQNQQDQIAEVERATGKQLEQFDEAHRKRIRQIETQGQEQQAAIAKQLEKEEGEYKKSQDRIEAEHGKLLERLKQQLDDKAKELFYPNQSRIEELKEAYRLLGEAFGREYTNALQGVIANGEVSGGMPSPNRPQRGSGLSPVGRSYTRGSVVESQKDAILSNEAIDQIVSGGRQSGSYNGVRSGDLHRGVDLATPLNSPVKSPIDGQIVAVGSTRTGGNYVIVQGANGDQWYFGHLNTANVRKGDQVRKGQVIARSGATGTAVTGPHVHVQLTRGGKPVDPTTSLEGLASSASSATPGTVSGRSATPTSQRVGGFSTPDIGSGPGGGEVLSIPPTLNLPPGSSSVSSSSVALTVDLRGAQFGAGVDPRNVEDAGYRGAQRALQEYDRQIARDIERSRTSGPPRIA